MKAEEAAYEHVRQIGLIDDDQSIDAHKGHEAYLDFLAGAQWATSSALTLLEEQIQKWEGVVRRAQFNLADKPGCFNIEETHAEINGIEMVTADLKSLVEQLKHL
jgi:hypothetical protein